MLHLPSPDEIIGFLVGTILIKYIVIGWITQLIVRLFKFIMIRTETEAITWIHYSEAARGRGHTTPTPLLCPDGLCIHIRDKKKT